MTHFGAIAPALHSHFAAMEALAMALVARGHQVTFFHQADARRYLQDSSPDVIRSKKIAFVAVGALTHPPGSLAKSLRRAASPDSFWGIRAVIKDMAASTDMLCRELPQAFKANSVEAVLCDQMEAAGGLVAQSMALPFVSVACALPVNREAAVPLPVMPFDFDVSPQALKRNAGSTQVYDFIMRPLGRVIAYHAAQFGLPARDGLHADSSPLAELSQTIAAFDFPRTKLPNNFHAVGPLRSAARPATNHPATSAANHAWQQEAAPDRPFVFASLGTMQGHRFGLFKKIAAACQRLDVQLLIAHCGGLNEDQSRLLVAHGATWVTDFTDQPAALQRADAVITHAGLNTVMDAIAARTPLLALPLAFDQPGVAARIVYRGIGKRASARFVSVKKLSSTLHDVLHDPTFKINLEGMALALQHSGGVSRAADIVEAVIASRPTLQIPDTVVVSPRSCTHQGRHD